MGFSAFTAVADAAESVLPLTIKSNGHNYTVKEISVEKGEDGNTTVTLTGSGFEVMPVRNGHMIMPVWCSFISDGVEYEWQNASTGQSSVMFIFTSGKDPEIIRLFAEDDRGDKYDFPIKQGRVYE